jgi:hypothetical protein
VAPIRRATRRIVAGAALCLVLVAAVILWLSTHHRAAATPDTTPSGVLLQSLQPPPSAPPSGTFDAAAAERLIDKMGYVVAPAINLAKVPGPLRGIAASCNDSATGRCREVFFFYGNRFAGVSEARGLDPFLFISSQDGKTVVVTYPTLAPGDPECCPSGPASTRRFAWDGNRVVETGPHPGPVPTSITTTFP